MVPYCAVVPQRGEVTVLGNITPSDQLEEQGQPWAGKGKGKLPYIRKALGVN